MAKSKNLHYKFLLEKYRFDTFTKEDSNQEALSAAFFVSTNPAEKLFNPLFIYGGSHLGKTHLAIAIGNEIKDRFPEKNVLCITSVLFCQQCNEAVENNKRDRLVNWLQLMDLFILEDVQFLSGQTISQEILLVISDIFLKKGKQIILTADRMLMDMHGIPPQLLSRFRAGIMVEFKSE